MGATLMNTPNLGALQRQRVTRRGSRQWTYELYGLSMRSDLRLPCREVGEASPPEIDLIRGSDSLFASVDQQISQGPVVADWFQHARLKDGSDYVCWTDHFDFLISPDGSRIVYRVRRGAAAESVHAYLFGQVLSFALLKRGREPLHATAVVVDGGCVAFVADCGEGKSTLGAAFIRRGYQMLTDDLLVLQGNGEGFLAHPGLPRIKLFPEQANEVFGHRVEGAALNRDTPKLIIPLSVDQHCRAAVPLRAIYVLSPPPSRGTRGVTVTPLAGREAFLELTRGAFNLVVTDSARLQSLFAATGRLAERVSVRRLAYARDTAELSVVCEAIIQDLCKLATPGAGNAHTIR